MYSNELVKGSANSSRGLLLSSSWRCNCGSASREGGACAQLGAELLWSTPFSAGGKTAYKDLCEVVLHGALTGHHKTPLTIVKEI